MRTGARPYLEAARAATFALACALGLGAARAQDVPAGDLAPAGRVRPRPRPTPRGSGGRRQAEKTQARGRQAAADEALQGRATPRPARRLRPERGARRERRVRPSPRSPRRRRRGAFPSRRTPSIPSANCVGDLKLTPYIEQDVGYATNPLRSGRRRQGLRASKPPRPGSACNRTGAATTCMAQLKAGYTDYFADSDRQRRPMARARSTAATTFRRISRSTPRAGSTSRSEPLSNLGSLGPRAESGRKPRSRPMARRSAARKNSAT